MKYFKTMRRIATLLAVILCAFPAMASLLTVSITNSVTGLPDTNYVKVIPLDDNNPVLADGSIVTKGFAKREYPDTNGVLTLWRGTGYWAITNSSIALIYRFSDMSSNATAYIQSGWNTYGPAVVNISTGGGGTTNVATTNSPDLVFSGNGSTASPITASFSLTQSNLLVNAVQAGSTNANLSITGNAVTASTALAAQYGSQLYSSLHSPNQLPSIALTVQTNFAQVNGTNYDAFPAMDSSPDGQTLYMVYRSAPLHTTIPGPFAERLMVSRDAGTSWQFVTNVFSDSIIDWRNINFGVLKTGPNAGRLMCMAWPAVWESSSSNYWSQGIVKASDDGGTNWFQIGTMPTNQQANAYVLCSANFGIYQNGNYLHAPAYSETQTGSSSIPYDLVSTNGGTNWTLNTIVAPATEVEPDLAVIPGTPNVIAITRTAKIYFNTNNGSGNWDYRGTAFTGSFAPPKIGLYPTGDGYDFYVQYGARSGYPMNEYFGRAPLDNFLSNPTIIGQSFQVIGLTALTNTIADGGYGSFVIGKDGSALVAWYYSTNFQTNASIVLNRVTSIPGTNFIFNTPYFRRYPVIGSSYNASILVNAADTNSIPNPNLATGISWWSDGTSWSADISSPGNGTLSTRHVRLITKTLSGGVLTATNVILDATDNGDVVIKRNLTIGGTYNGNGNSLTNLNGANIQSGTVKTNAIDSTFRAWVLSQATGGGGGSATNLTPWTSDIDAAGFSLTNANLLQANSIQATNFTADNLYLSFTSAIPYVNSTSNMVPLSLSSAFTLSSGTLSITPNTFDAYGAALAATNGLGSAAFTSSSSYVAASGGTLSSGTFNGGTILGANDLNGTLTLNAGGEAINVSGGAQINVGSASGGIVGNLAGVSNAPITLGGSSITASNGADGVMMLVVDGSGKAATNAINFTTTSSFQTFTNGLTIGAFTNAPVSTAGTTNLIAGWMLIYTNPATSAQRWVPYITNHP